MILPALLFTILLSLHNVRSLDLNSAIRRTECYQNEQLNCNQDFIDVYPDLSQSVTNLSKADTLFLLFTRKNPDAPEKLHKCGGKLPSDTNFDPSQDLIVIVTPFAVGFCDVAVFREWVYEILKRDNYNVLAIDYSWGNHVDYGTAIMNIKIVAKQTVIVLKNIQEKTGLKKDQISLVGLSLGAHLAGLIGQGIPVKRITGLDPAGPGFDAEKVPADDRLDMSDADFVDVWHCNAGKCLPKLGTIYDTGHVNFYINGGTVQPPCHKYAVISLSKGDYIYGLGTALLPDTCYHAQCAQYYKVSINPGNCKFLGMECGSYSDFKSGKCNNCDRNSQNCLVMGFDTDMYINSNISSPRKYYLDTTDACPYCGYSNIPLGRFFQHI